MGESFTLMEMNTKKREKHGTRHGFRDTYCKKQLTQVELLFRTSIKKSYSYHSPLFERSRSKYLIGCTQQFTY